MSTNKTLQRELELTGITSDNPFQTTLFGWQFLLVGLDASERIVYRHPLHKEARAGGQELVPYIAVPDFDTKGHPRTLRYRPTGDDFLGQKYFQLVSEGLHSVKSLDDATHTVSHWYLLGIDGNDPLDTAAYAGTAPEGEQGGGRYGIGAVLDDTARADMTNTGRMWLHWQGDPVEVSASSALPVLFTRQDDGSLRLVHTHWDRETAWHSVNKKPLITEAGSTALMALGLNQLFDADTSKSDIPAIVRAYGDELVRRALELDHAAGIDSQIPVSPLLELPSNYTALLPIREKVAQGEPLLGDFVFNTDHQETWKTATGFYTNSVWSAMWHEPGFIWPADGQGVKLTVSFRVRMDHPQYGCIFKLARASSNFYNEAASLNLKVFSPDGTPEINAIGPYDGTHSPYVPAQYLTKNDKETRLHFDSMYYDNYEVYIYPDKRAFVYKNGRYAGVLDVPEFLIEPGERYTVGANMRMGSAFFYDIHAEAFEVPASYEASPRESKITAVDLTGTISDNLDPVWLLDTDTTTNSGIVAFRPPSSSEDHIEFNITSPGKLSIFMRPGYRGEWELRRLKPTGNNHPFDSEDPLDPVNLSSFMTGETPLNDWYTFPFVLPSGRYHLHATAPVEDANYVYLRRWRVDPVESDQPRLVDTWPLGATFEGNDIASTLNSEQLEFEDGVNGVHLNSDNHSFSFVVTHDAKLRIHPHTYAGRLRLHRVDGKDLSLVTDQLVSGEWYEFPYRIPAGKYQLSGVISKKTTLTAWEALAPGDLPEAPVPAALPVPLDVEAMSYGGNNWKRGAEAVPLLTDGKTHIDGYTGELLLRTDYYIDFDVLEESFLSVHSTGDVGPSGSYGRFHLYRVDGDNTTYFDSTYYYMRKWSWCAFPRPLPPGRYRLMGTYSSQWARITEWHLSPANQLQLPSVPVIYDIDGKDTTWTESASNAHTVLTDGDASGWGQDHGIRLDNNGGVDYLRFRISKPADLLITPASDRYTGPVTLRRVNPTGGVTDVATFSMGKAGEASRFGYQIEPGKYLLYGHGSNSIGDIVINQLAVEDGQNLPTLPAKPRATVTASVSTGRDIGIVESALNDLMTPGAAQTTSSNSVPLKENAYIEFTLDHDAIMSLFSVLTHRALLYRVFGEGDSEVEEPFYAYWAYNNDWTATPFNLPAGTYRLYGGAPHSGWGPILTQWAFSIPSLGYSTTPPPSIMDIDASGTAQISGNESFELVNGSTHYVPETPTERSVTLKAAELDVDGNEIAPAQNVVWFTLTQDADLSLFSAGGGNDPVQLLSEDGVTVDLTTGPLTDENWTSFGQTIPAGRYQLVGQGTTIITEIKAEAPVAAV